MVGQSFRRPIIPSYYIEDWQILNSVAAFQPNYCTPAIITREAVRGKTAVLLWFCKIESGGSGSAPPCYGGPTLLGSAFDNPLLITNHSGLQNTLEY